MLRVGPVVLLLFAQKLPAKAVRLVRAAVGMTKNEVEVLVARADKEALLVLPSAPPAEHGNGDRVETDEMCPLRLWQRLDPQRVVDDGDLLREHRSCEVEVDIAPGDPEALASPTTGCGLFAMKRGA